MFVVTCFDTGLVLAVVDDIAKIPWNGGVIEPIPGGGSVMTSLQGSNDVVVVTNIELNNTDNI